MLSGPNFAPGARVFGRGFRFRRVLQAQPGKTKAHKSALKNKPADCRQESQTSGLSESQKNKGLEVKVRVSLQ